MNHNKSVIAKRLASIGLLPIPVKENKSSLIKWSNVTLANVNDEYLRAFDQKSATGIALVSGKRSGNLECIDIDCKYDLDGNLYDLVINAIIDYSHELYTKLVIVKTPSGGYHILYRTPSVRRNMKLARRFQSPQEHAQVIEQNRSQGKDENVRAQQVVLIETRGEGGYFLCWPSEGYVFEKGGFSDIADITEQESKAIIDICMSLDQIGSEVDAMSAAAGLAKIEEFAPPKLLTKKTKYIKTPWDDYNDRADTLSFLTSQGWSIVRNVPSPDDGRIVTYLKRPGVTDKDVSATYNHVPNRVYCFTSSTSLPTNIPLTPFEVYFRIAHGGSQKAAIEAVEAMGYGVRANSSPSDKLSDEVGVKSNMSRMLSRDNDATRGSELNVWWEVEVTERKNGSIKKEIHIKQSLLIDWLNSKGLRKMYSGGKYDYYMLDGCICDFVTRADIAKFISDYIKELPSKFDFISPAELLEAFTRGADTYLSQVRLELVSNIDEDSFMRDKENESYIPFSNGVLKITKDSMDIIPYHKFSMLVWRSAIKKYDFKEFEDDVLDAHDFNRFLFNISSKNKDRYRNLQQMIGYMLSTYKDPGLNAAIILMDQKLTDNSDGGTGKGILVKAMSHVRSTVYEDGKVANKKNQSDFRFSRVTKDSHIIHLSDIEKHFDFEAMFTLITEGLPLNKKFRDEEFIPYSKSPKIIISTNYSVGGRGNSHDRRRIEFELPPHYTKTFTPMHEFGRNLFDSWDSRDWQVFYGIMARCLRSYLTFGMPSFVGINIEARKFIAETSPEFVAWFNIVFGTPDHVSKHGPKFSGKISFSQIYSEYLTYSGLERHETRPVKFIRYIQSGCRHLNLDMQEVSEVKNPYNRELERFIVITDPMLDQKKKQFEESLMLKS